MPSTRGRQLAGVDENQGVLPGLGAWNTCYVCGQGISGRAYDDQGKGRRHVDCPRAEGVTASMKIYVASARGTPAPITPKKAS